MLIRNTKETYCLEGYADNGCCCCNCKFSYTIVDIHGNPVGKFCKITFPNERPLTIKLNSNGHGLCECWASTNENLENKFFNG